MIEGFRHFKGYLDPNAQSALLGAIRAVISAAPLYRPQMPRTGRPLSVKMTNAGALGWVCDKTGGYRYQPLHPETGTPWPPIPDQLLKIWHDLSQWHQQPEACLINYYCTTAKMGSHIDADEQARDAPVVSISLGDDAVFHVGGPKRSDNKARLTLASGDIVVLSGPARRAYHGIDRIKAGTAKLLDEGGRFNLTLRRVSL